MLPNGRPDKTDKTGSNSSVNGPKDREPREDLLQREKTLHPLPQAQGFTGWAWDYCDDAIDPYPTKH
jgi:hypothetical protein